MEVHLYDGRIGEWRQRDVPLPLEDELVLSRCARGGFREWRHDVYQRIGARAFAFIGHAPTVPRAGDGNELPAPFTVLHTGYLQPYWESVRPLAWSHVGGGESL